jgi:hypothetical protein
MTRSDWGVKKQNREPVGLETLDVWRRYLIGKARSPRIRGALCVRSGGCVGTPRRGLSFCALGPAPATIASRCITVEAEINAANRSTASPSSTQKVTNVADGPRIDSRIPLRDRLPLGRDAVTPSIPLHCITFAVAAEAVGCGGRRSAAVANKKRGEGELCACC